MKKNVLESSLLPLMEHDGSLARWRFFVQMLCAVSTLSMLWDGRPKLWTTLGKGLLLTRKKTFRTAEKSRKPHLKSTGSDRILCQGKSRAVQGLSFKRAIAIDFQTRLFSLGSTGLRPFSAIITNQWYHRVCLTLRKAQKKQETYHRNAEIWTVLRQT